MVLARLFSLLLLITGPLVLYGQDTHVLSPEKILKLIPDKIKGFKETDEPKARQTKLGNITYSLAEKHYHSGQHTIKILLFDYKEAPIMYNQAMKEWSSHATVDTDTLVFRSLAMNNCSGWESYNIHSKRSQIFLGICDRFFMMITGENTDLVILRRALQEIPLAEFPK
jgi:hypothetical protein